MSGFVGTNNLFDTGTASASSEAAGFEKENGFDYKAFDWWQPSSGGTYFLTVDAGSAVAVDYVGIAAHNLFAESATVTVQYSTDNFAADTNDAFTSEAVPSNTTYVKRFTQQTKRYWRLKVVSTNAALIGHVSIGELLETPTGQDIGFSPGQFSPDDDVINSRAEGGVLLGRSINRQGQEISPFQFRNLTPAWVRDNWPALYAHIIKKPFFVAWDYTNYPLEVSFAWTKGDIRGPRYSSHDRMEFSLDLKAKD